MLHNGAKFGAKCTQATSGLEHCPTSHTTAVVGSGGFLANTKYNVWMIEHLQTGVAMKRQGYNIHE